MSSERMDSRRGCRITERTGSTSRSSLARRASRWTTPWARPSTAPCGASASR